MDYMNFNALTGKVLGSTFGDATIPAGSDVLTTIAFSNAEYEICFVESGCVDDYDNDESTPSTIEYGDAAEEA